MIFNSILAAASDDDQVLETRGYGLFHRILDYRLVDQRQHLLWLRFRGWKEPCPQTRSREYGSPDSNHFPSIAPNEAIQTTALCNVNAK